MIADILTLMRKDLREALLLRGSLRGTLIMTLVPIAIFGVYFPYQIGRAWVESPLAFLSATWLPLLYAGALVADSIAGERERHTLETLLASRISAQGLLIGKLAAVISYTASITVVMLIAGIATVSIAHGEGHILFFPPRIALFGILFGILVTLLVASAGMLVSSRAATVRQAHQTVSLALIALWFIPIIGMQLVPKHILAMLESRAGQYDGATIAVAVAAILIVVDSILLKIVSTRFTRDRLMNRS